MRINNVSSSQVTNIYSNKKQRVEDNMNNKIKDVIEISSIGKELSNYEISHKGQPSIEKVNKVKSMMEAGTYTVDSKLIASKMIDYMKNRHI